MSMFSRVKHRLSAHRPSQHFKPSALETPVEASAPRLPYDIVEIILHELRKYSVKALVSAMAVCREWREAGEIILWTHAVLRPSRIDAFLTSIKPAYAQYLHSLTISFKNYYSIVRSEDLSLVPRAVESLPQLQIFSIRISNARFDYRVNRDLEKIVTSLPPSLRSLQIELGAEVSKDKYGTSCHSLTVAIGEILPQLQHLRIYGKICCQHLFEAIYTPCPRLESIIINSFPNPTPVTICGNRLDYINDHLIFKAQQFVQHGIAPSLHTFTIIQQHFDKRYYIRQRAVGELLRNTIIPMAVQVKRILLEQTSVFPVLFDGTDHAACVRLPGHGLYRDLWGNKFDVAYALEQDDAWYHTVTGSSFPPLLMKSVTGRAARLLQEQQPQRLNIEQRKNTFRQHGLIRPWYDIENNSGVVLIHPSTHHGLGND